MNAEEAQALLDSMYPTVMCSLCGLKNPPVEDRPYFDAFDQPHPVHAGCPSTKKGPALVENVYLTNEQVRDALRSVVNLHNHLKEVLPYAMEPCDQTVQCPQCDAVWWGVPEDITEDWHAPGCGIHQARVTVGLSTNVRKRDKDTPAKPYQPNEPRPDTRTPSEILRDQVLSGFFYQINRLLYGEPPQGIDKDTWQKVGVKMRDQLLDFQPPEKGPFGR